MQNIPEIPHYDPSGPQIYPFDSTKTHNFLTVLEGAAAEIHAEALELMNANVITTLEYARELAGTTTAADFVELSGTQARKQCQLILKQASALKSLTQTIAKSGTD